jgi:hypothetical protein
MELLAIWQRVFYLVCALLGMGVEGACGGVIGERHARWCFRVWSGGDGAGTMRQQVRQGEGAGVAGDDDGGGCAAKGKWGGGSAHGGGHVCGGHG